MRSLRVVTHDVWNFVESNWGSVSYHGYYDDTCDKLDDVGKYVDSTSTESSIKGFIERKKIFAVRK